MRLHLGSILTSACVLSNGALFAQQVPETRPLQSFSWSEAKLAMRAADPLAVVVPLENGRLRLGRDDPEAGFLAGSAYFDVSVPVLLRALRRDSIPRLDGNSPLSELAKWTANLRSTQGGSSPETAPVELGKWVRGAAESKVSNSEEAEILFAEARMQLARLLLRRVESKADSLKGYPNVEKVIRLKLAVLDAIDRENALQRLTVRGDVRVEVASVLAESVKNGEIREQVLKELQSLRETFKTEEREILRMEAEIARFYQEVRLLSESIRTASRQMKSVVGDSKPSDASVVRQAAKLLIDIQEDLKKLGVAAPQGPEAGRANLPEGRWRNWDTRNDFRPFEMLADLESIGPRLVKNARERAEKIQKDARKNQNDARKSLSGAEIRLFEIADSWDFRKADELRLKLEQLRRLLDEAPRK